ncbi:hypothetical protein, partial [uncultured Parasutterella sp.]|uniref:hypothetical protein n=1 Tax=uncultured Parasutterella sp. TaxID=1263098 RepID=UPI00258FAD5A
CSSIRKIGVRPDCRCAKKLLLEFLGINSLNEHQVAELLCDVVRAYAEEASYKKELHSSSMMRSASKAIKGTTVQANGKQVDTT